MKKFHAISEVSKIVNLIDPLTNKPQNHILRYWEKEFKQINPKKINNRRYYTLNQINIIKNIKFLLRNKGMTINGVKNILNSDVNSLDQHIKDSLKANLKTKSKLILEKIKKIKNYGKKISS